MACVGRVARILRGTGSGSKLLYLGLVKFETEAWPVRNMQITVLDDQRFSEQEFMNHDFCEFNNRIGIDDG